MKFPWGTWAQNGDWHIGEVKRVRLWTPWPFLEDFTCKFDELFLVTGWKCHSVGASIPTSSPQPQKRNKEWLSAICLWKCQEGFLNIADESRFLRQEGPTCKKSIKSFYSGLWNGKCFCLSLYPIRYIWHHMYFGTWELFDSVTKVNGIKRKWCESKFKKYRKAPLEVKILWNNYLVLWK